MHLHRRTHTSGLRARIKQAVDGAFAHGAERCASARSDVFVTQRQMCIRDSHRRTHTSALCAPIKKAVDGGIAHDAERCASGLVRDKTR